MTKISYDEKKLGGNVRIKFWVCQIFEGGGIGDGVDGKWLCWHHLYLVVVFLYSLFDDLDLLNITRGGTGDGVSGKWQCWHILYLFVVFFILQFWFSGFVEYCEEVDVVVFIFPYWCWIFWGGGTGGRGGWWVTVMTQQITLMIQPPLIVQLKPPLFQIFHFLISHFYFFSYFLSQS